MSPKRFQVTSYRTPNPPNGKRVIRRSRWGNPTPIEEAGSAAAAVPRFREHLAEHPELVALGRRELRGFDLGCTCPLGEPCHAITAGSRWRQCQPSSAGVRFFNHSQPPKDGVLKRHRITRCDHLHASAGRFVAWRQRR
jgi:hypothetical protein